jgi:nitrogenase subunit NifH
MKRAGIIRFIRAFWPSHVAFFLVSVAFAGAAFVIFRLLGDIVAGGPAMAACGTSAVFLCTFSSYLYLKAGEA